MALYIIDFPIDDKIRKPGFLNNEWPNKDFFLFRTSWHVVRIKKTSVMNRFLPPLGGLKNVRCFHDLVLRAYNRCLHQYFINIWFFFLQFNFLIYIRMSHFKSYFTKTIRNDALPLLFLPTSTLISLHFHCILFHSKHFPEYKKKGQKCFVKV